MGLNALAICPTTPWNVVEIPEAMDGDEAIRARCAHNPATCPGARNIMRLHKSSWVDPRPFNASTPVSTTARASSATLIKTDDKNAPCEERTIVAASEQDHKIGLSWKHHDRCSGERAQEMATHES